MEQLLHLLQTRRHHTAGYYEDAVSIRRAILRGLRPAQVKYAEIRAIPDALSGRERLVAENAPMYEGRLDYITGVRLTTSLSQLLDLASTRGTSPVDKRQRLEALMTFDAAIAMLRMEEMNSVRIVKNVAREFGSRVERDLFTGREATLRAWSEHDPSKHYEAADVRFHRSHGRHAGTQRSWQLFCRHMKLAGAETPVIYGERVKRRFDTWLKLQKQYDGNDLKRRERWSEVWDQCGLRFTVQDVASANAFFEELVVFVERLEGEIVEKTNNLSEAARGDKTNHHSSLKYRAAKLIVRWHGQYFELQVQTLRDYVNDLVATDDRNHKIYRLSQCLDYYFPLVFPLLYGVNWQDREVRRELMDWRINSLGLLVAPGR